MSSWLFTPFCSLILNRILRCVTHLRIFMLGLFLSINAGAVEHGDYHGDYKVDWDLQDRVMYNQSNIASSKNYDFFSQRVRLGVSMESAEKLGAYTQIEYRGTFGAVNGYDAANAPFNRLNARGVRYGYLYAPMAVGQLKVGLVPLNDQVHQTLFSADWDFNVGGLTYTIQNDTWNGRFAYLRLVDGKDLTSAAPNGNSDEDQSLVIADANSAYGALTYGLHYYGLYGKVCLNKAVCNSTPSTATGTDFIRQEQHWIAATLAWNGEALPVDLFAVYNTGKIANVKNEGFLAFVEARKYFSGIKVSLLASESTGHSADSSDNATGTGYQTVEQLKGSAGYWGYAHIFSANGASDVNGYLVNPSNKGFGLQTVHAKFATDLGEKWNVAVYDAFFKADTAMNNAAGMSLGTALGNEYGLQFGCKLDKFMKWEFGFAAANLGDAAKALYQQTGDSTVHEIFSRFQLEI